MVAAGSRAGRRDAPGGHQRPYDVEQIRQDFPILASKVYGKPLVYLDNGASAQKPKAVLDRIQHAYTAEYANVHRGLHYLANAATEAYEGARETVRAFLNAERPQEIIFTRNAPRRSTWSRRPSGASGSARATRSCSRSWSTTPTSCPGISCASGRAP